jgi:hypothetical protein
MKPSVHKSGESMVKEKEVPLETPVWVQCEGYRCLAVLSRQGEWRTLYNDKPLPKVIRVLSHPRKV